MKKYTLLILIAFSTFCKINAQIDSIKTTFNKLKLQSIKESANNYLVYMEKPDGSLVNMAIWKRETKLTHDKIIIKQHWQTTDSATTRYVYSECNRGNFAPLYHYSKWGKHIDAFDFKKQIVIGSDSIPNKRKEGFKKNYDYKPFNWELDLEVMKLLPYKFGKTFAINFYHPGSNASPSKFYEYKVLKKEYIENSFDGKTECWVLQIHYAQDDEAIFWISVKTQDVLKMVEHYRDFTRYKIKL